MLKPDPSPRPACGERPTSRRLGGSGGAALARRRAVCGWDRNWVIWPIHREGRRAYTWRQTSPRWWRRRKRPQPSRRPPMTMTSEQKKSHARRIYDELWNQEKLGLASELFSDDYEN